MSRNLPRRLANTFLAAWWLPWLAVLAIILYIIFMTAQAVSLQISGSSSGLGWHTLNVSGDQFNISILQNGTAWNVSLVGCT